MERNHQRVINNGGRGIEENTLAIIDASADKDTHDANDDRIAFLHAVRAASIVPEIGTPPTNKMLEAIFEILRAGKSLELIMASYQLLNELDEHFPRVSFSNIDKSNSTCSTPPELVVANEAWSPFGLSLDIASTDLDVVEKNMSVPFHSLGFYLLIQDIAEVTAQTNFQMLDAKSLRNMFLFQYLVNVLERDFLPRNRLYKETMNWDLLRESLLNMLLGSRRISYKTFVKECVSILCRLNQFVIQSSNDLTYEETSAEKMSENHDTSVEFALLEVGKNTCISVQKLLITIMELDVSKKKADMEGCTTRIDGARTPVVEIILDELTYDKDIISPFLLVFNEPKWKLELVLQYIWKYIPKPRTRRSNASTCDATFSGVWNIFSNNTTTKGIIKKIGGEVVQLLLAHLFEAYWSLSSRPFEGMSTSKEEFGGNSLVEICENIISAFNSLRRADASMEISPIGKEALFAAATVISTNSGLPATFS